MMPPEWLHTVLSASVLCQPIWISFLKSWYHDNPAPSALNISLILFPSHTPPLCLKAWFLDDNWQERARTSFSYVILRKKNCEKGAIMQIHNDVDLAANALERSHTPPDSYGTDEPQGDASKPYP